MNTLLGAPADRLPFVEWGSFASCFGFSRWDRHIGADTDPRQYFGFDNAELGGCYETVPIEWFALPPFREKTLPNDGRYNRRIDHRFGEVVRELPRDPQCPMEVRVFEDHPVKSRDDWRGLKERFRLETTCRFPDDWDRWCARSKTATNPIGLVLRGPSKAAQSALGLEGEAGLLFSVYDRPEFVKEILDHFAVLSLICAEKALAEASIDLTVVIDELAGNKGLLFSPEIVEELFLPSIRRFADLVRSHGVATVLLYQRGNLSAGFDLYRRSGINGLIGVEDANDMPLGSLIDNYGDSICIVGGIDGRTLRGTTEEIDREVEEKVAIARSGRVVPCLSTHVLPEIEFKKYSYYANYLRRAVGA